MLRRAANGRCMEQGKRTGSMRSSLASARLTIVYIGADLDFAPAMALREVGGHGERTIRDKDSVERSTSTTSSLAQYPISKYLTSINNINSWHLQN